VAKQFVLQMAGHPGSGKSNVARAIQKATGAVLLDKDVIKSPMVEHDVEDEIAGPLNYAVFLALGRSIAEQGHSIILDSPAYYPIIITQGQSIAEDIDADYYIIECICSDREELERRLAHRERMPSQIDRIEGDPLEQPGADEISEPHLELDTAGKIEPVVAKALKYLGRTNGRSKK
jgi:predicted kinase